MTVQQSIDYANKMKAGNAVPDDMKVRWLNELEATIYEDLIRTHCHDLRSRWWHRNEETHCWEFVPAPVYEVGTDDDRTMIAPAPFDEIYVYWLMAKIDLFAQELNKYNNDYALFQQLYDRYKRSYHNKHHSAYTPEIKVGVFR